MSATKNTADDVIGDIKNLRINAHEMSATKNTADDVIGAMSLIEDVDMNNLRIIRDNFQELWNRNLGQKMKIQVKGGIYKTIKESKQAYAVINELYRSKEKTNVVKYRFSPRITYGRRIHCSPSLQECHRPIRHTIAKDIYYDLDIKNAHCVFLLNLCRSYEFTHPILERYVEGDREGFLQSMLGLEITKVDVNELDEIAFVKHTIACREDAKAYFLQCINGGGNARTSSKTMNAFYTRQQEFLCLFFNRKDNDKYRLRAIDAVKKKEWDNKEGSALNYFLCEVENNVLTHIEMCLQEMEIRYGTLCYDGLLIYRDSVKDISGSIQKIQTVVSERMGFTIQLTVKEMDEALDLTGLYPKEDFDMTDEGLAKRLLEFIKPDIRYSKKHKAMYHFNKTTCLWEVYEIECLKTIISSTLIPLMQNAPDKEKIPHYIQIVKSNTKQNAIISQMKSHIMMMNDDDVIETKFDLGNGLFPLADNNVMDFRTLIVRPRQKNDFFTRTTQRKYLGAQSTKYESLYAKKYFHDVLVKFRQEDQKVGDTVHNAHFCESCKTNGYICPSEAYQQCLVQTFACILTGEMNRSMKKFINLIGEGNNGKSLFLELMQTILEDFSGSVGNRVIVEQKNKSGHDAELFGLANKWMMSLSETDAKSSYDEVRLKQITGHDLVPLRDAGGNSKSMIQVRFKAVPVCSTNEVCHFKSPAFMNRLMCFAFHFRFTQDQKIADEVISKADEFFSYLCGYANDYYKNGQTFHIADEVVSYTNIIKKEQDPFLLWLDNPRIMELDLNGKPVRGEDLTEHRISKDRMYYAYKLFCDSHNHPFVGPTSFHRDFQKMFEVSTTKVMVETNQGELKQKECYVGFRILEDGCD